MITTKGSFYRAEAVQRYLEDRETTVMPRLVSPPIFMYLWFLLGLLMVSGFLAWGAQVPVYASGSAVVVLWSANTQPIREEIVVVAFVPPENLSRLRVGQRLFLPLEGVGTRADRAIIAVEPEISSPDMARRRFALSTSAAQVITQPSAAAIARLEPLPAGLPAAAYVGSVYRAEIEVGSQRVISLLPLIGQLFKE